MGAYIAATFLILGGLALVCGVHGIGGGLRRREETDGALTLVRGARRAIVGAALLVISLATALDNEKLLLFGVVFLLEEIYETTLVLGLMKWNAAQESSDLGG